ncbi:sulfur oxidation c-type cytochrome SoxA [Thermocrinis minervae]|uniref:L-cysteine S-thiosulfotransferase subunit SoxA n=1 Tax=Thermocrinis minervae TaxID=381751 RepID=A0A1M6T8E3_9AQUI|nr:sulfur oxidation c-type cytochrome SoxA [Thermocrinis minervae]SHK53038.1 diheme cytochrome SoxA (sulfur oxidation) [Thermocrinis minervae]
MKRVFVGGALIAGAILIGLYSLSKAQEKELTPEEEIRLVQEANRMLAEGLNPAEYWYETGKELFKKYKLDKCDFGLGPGVVKGALAQLPRYFDDAKRVMDLETRLAYCLEKYAGMKKEDVVKFAKQCWGKTNCYSEYDALVTYISMESNGYKVNVNLKDPRVKAEYEKGKALFYARRGPWDFNCAVCHAGQKEQRIRATALWSIDRDEAKQVVTKFPIYRVSWNQVFPMHYRYAECLRQMRWPELEPFSEYAVAMSTFLYGSANGAVIKIPGIGR